VEPGAATISSRLTQETAQLSCVSQVQSGLWQLCGLPVFVFTGSDNVVYTQESSAKTYRLLRDTFKTKDVRMKVFEGFDHLDCWLSERVADKGSVFEAVEAEVRHVLCEADSPAT